MIMTLILAACLDYAIADPRQWLHPVQVMGWSIARLTSISLKLAPKPWQRYSLGIILGTSVILASTGLSWIFLRQLAQWQGAIALIVEVILLASCFAGRSLRQAVNSVLDPLRNHQKDEARRQLSRFVGRDTQNLDQADIFRALLETIAENAIDGVMAPLFYALLGACLPIGPVPLALGYKAASTLDSMIGYRRSPYREIGWFSAKLEDSLTWLPCRFSVLTLGLMTGKIQEVWRICWRDARRDPSPNSGWSEGVYAAILGVQLGGCNTYQGVIIEKPLLGDRHCPITTETVYAALRLTRWCFLAWLIVGIIVLWLQSRELHW